MVFVTGGTGLLGSHVLFKLAENNFEILASKRPNSNVERVRKVFSYYSNKADALFEKIKWVDVALEEYHEIEPVLEGIDCVYHCSGFVSFQKKDEELLKVANEIVTTNLLNACLNKGIRVFCHVSSIATINNNDYTGELHEGVFWKTSGDESYYGITKYNAEREVWRASEEGLNVVIVNPAVILAPGFWGQSSGKLIAFCHKGRLFYTEGVTGYVDALDVATIMLELVKEKKFNNRYIVLEGMYSFKEIFSMIQSEFGKNPPRLKAPTFLLKMGVFFDSTLSKLTGKTQILTKETVTSAIATKKLSNQKILNDLKFTYRPIKSSIHSICTIFKAEKKLKF
ncbi:MAG: NAD-dependent epimerase/dehydratase family protein [Bacteroidia bacterium]